MKDMKDMKDMNENNNNNENNSGIIDDIPLLVEDRIKVVDENTKMSVRTISYTIAGSYVLSLHDTKKVQQNEQQVHPNVHINNSNNNNNKVWLFLYPAGVNSRMLLLLHRAAVHANVTFVSVNRPGTKGTSRSNSTCTANRKLSVAQVHINTTVHDIVHVLDHLHVTTVAGIFCMCAGCPFAMKFVCTYPHRVSSTIRFVSGAGWVLPSDCGWNNSTTLYTLGTIVPSFVSSSFFVGAQCIGKTILQLLSNNVRLELLKSQLSHDEIILFNDMYGQKIINNNHHPCQNNSKNESSQQSSVKNEVSVAQVVFEWIQYKKSTGSTTGSGDEENGDAEDIAVLMSTSDHLGIDYYKFQRIILQGGGGSGGGGGVSMQSIAQDTDVSSSIPKGVTNLDEMNNSSTNSNNSNNCNVIGGTIRWFHGTKDTVVPFASGKWLMDRLLLQQATTNNKRISLIEITDGTHQGVLLLLHPIIGQALLE